jgi:hypothetical protein
MVPAGNRDFRAERDGVNDDALPAHTLHDLLAYRKAAIAVTATYLGLEDEFVASVLADRMDEWLDSQAPPRETLKTDRYDEYLSLLGKEILVRYAATAAESLMADPGSDLASKRIMGDTGGLGIVDDVNAVVRVHEIFELLESPDAGDDAERIMAHVKRQLCNYYSACAYTLVKGQLLPVIIEAAEHLYLKGCLTPLQVKELVIAEQER